MSRFPQIAPESATGTAKDLLDAVQKKLGLVPNMTRVMANAPSVLKGYLEFSGALASGEVSAKIRERIALAVGEANGCDYCLAAHGTIGKMVGLTADEIRDSREGVASDAKTNAILDLARKLVERRGRVSNADLVEARAAGLSDGVIVEVVGNVALNIFTNYFNHVAETDIDFPKAEALAAR